MKKICITCGNEFECKNSTLTCSEECKKKYKDKKNRTNVHRYTMQMKDLFFEHYGDTCAICGEDDKHVLTIDHIHDDGATHRKNVGDCTYTVVKDLKARNWPVDEVQTLCYNCNNKKKMLKQTVDELSQASILRESILNKLGHKCIGCGECDKNMLEIRPKNGNIKLYKAFYKNRNTLLKAMLKEDELSDEFEILCVNCHRRLQYTGFRQVTKNKYLKVMVKQ